MMADMTATNIYNSIVIMCRDGNTINVNNGGAQYSPMVMELIRMGQTFTLRQLTALLTAGYAIEDGAATA